MAGRAEADNVVTWEAADRGARCTLGCTVFLLLAAGLGLGVWSFWGGVWKPIVGAVLLLVGIGLLLWMRSPARGRWEISFDPDRKLVRLTSCKGSESSEREFDFREIAEIELEEIRRDVTTGENVPYLLPVFRLKNGETVRLNERMSIKDPERAREVVEQMRALIGRRRAGGSGDA